MLKRGFVNFIKRQKFLIYERAWLVAIMVFMVNSALIAAHSENSPIKPASACLHSAKNGGSKFTNSKVDFEKLKSAFQAARDKSDFTLKKKVLETMSEFYEFYKKELNLRSLHHLSILLNRNQTTTKVERNANKNVDSFLPDLLSEIEVKSVAEFPSWNLKEENGLRHIRRFNEKTGFAIDSNKFKVLSSRVEDSRILFVLLNPLSSKDFAKNTLKVYETDGSSISEAQFEFKAQLDFYVLSASKDRILVLGDRGGVLEIKKKNAVWERIEAEASIGRQYFLSSIVNLEGDIFRLDYEDKAAKSDFRFNFPHIEGFLGFYHKDEFRLQKLDILDIPGGVRLLVGNSKNIFLKAGKDNKALRLEGGEWKEYPVSQSLKLWGHSKFGNVIAVNDNVFLNHHANKLYKIEFDGTKFISSKLMSLKGEVVNIYAENNQYLQVLDRKRKLLTTYKIQKDASGDYHLTKKISSFEDPSHIRPNSYGFSELKVSLTTNSSVNREELDLLFLQEKINKKPYLHFHGENFYFLRNDDFYWFYQSGENFTKIQLAESSVEVKELSSEIFPSFIEAVFLIRDLANNIQLLEIYRGGRYSLHDLKDLDLKREDLSRMKNDQINYSEKGYRMKDKFFLINRIPYEDLFEE